MKPPYSELDVVAGEKQSDDSFLGFTPTSFATYLGQTNLKKKLSVYVQASALRNEPLDHMLLFGPPGLGKTTLSEVIAHELGVPCTTTSAPIIERTGDLVAILTNLQPKQVLFIDEIHRLSKQVEEVLYTAMEHFYIDMMVGQGAGAKSIRLPLSPFTLVGATTKAALLSGPLQTRFGIVERLDFYQAQELAAIVEQNAAHLNISITSGAALKIGQRARGTPRIVKRLLRRVRDFAQVQQETEIHEAVVEEALTFLGIDQYGLHKLDRDILTCILKHFNGGPVGLDTLAAITGEDKETIEDFCEPYLMRQGLLQKTPRGRQIPPQKVAHLRYQLHITDEENAESQQPLFKL